MKDWLVGLMVPFTLDGASDSSDQRAENRRVSVVTKTPSSIGTSETESQGEEDLRSKASTEETYRLTHKSPTGLQQYNFAAGAAFSALYSLLAPGLNVPNPLGDPLPLLPGFMPGLYPLPTTRSFGFQHELLRPKFPTSLPSNNTTSLFPTAVSSVQLRLGT